MKLVDRLRQQCRIRSENQIDMPVLGLAGCHGRQNGKWKIAGTLSPPCCLVFVGQDGQSWVPGPLLWLTNDMTQEFEKRSNHTCWKSGKRKTDAQRRQQVEVLHLFRCFTHTHTETHVYIYIGRESVCVCAEGLKPSKKAHQKIRVLVNTTNLTRTHGGDANDGMPSHHEWTNLGGDGSRDACGSYCILLVQLFYPYFGGTQKWKNISSSRREPSKVMFEPNKHIFK